VERLRLFVILAAISTTAAGAGDDIKWTKSKELKFVPINSDTDSISDNFEKTSSRYSLNWKPFGQHKIEFIQAVLYNWEVYVSDLKTQGKAGKINADVMPSEIAKGAQVYSQYFTFFVSVNAYAPAYVYLEKGGPWTIYLVDPSTGEPVPPVSIEPVGEFLAGVFEDGYAYGGAGVYISGAVQQTFELVFPCADASSYHNSVKLVLTSDLCRRGFEWRFEDE
jgi:hypothetical protein